MILGTLSKTVWEAGELMVIPVSDANASGKTVSFPSGGVTLLSQTADEIRLNVPDPKAHGDKTTEYLSDFLMSVTDDGDTETVSIQIAPAAGHFYGQIAALTGIYEDDAGVEIGQNAYAQKISGGNVDVDITTGLIISTGVSTVRYWVQDDDTGVWSDPADEIIQPSLADFILRFSDLTVPPKLSTNPLLDTSPYLREGFRD